MPRSVRRAAPERRPPARSGREPYPGADTGTRWPGTYGRWSLAFAGGAPRRRQTRPASGRPSGACRPGIRRGRGLRASRPRGGRLAGRRLAEARRESVPSLPCPWPRPTVPLPPATGCRSGAVFARVLGARSLVVGRPLAAVGQLVGLGLGVCQDVARCRSRSSRASGGLRPPPSSRRGPRAGRSPWTRRSGPGRRGADTRGPPRTRGQRRRSRAACRRGRHPTERARRRSRGASPRTGACRRTCARPSRRWARRLAGVARQQDPGPGGDLGRAHAGQPLGPLPVSRAQRDRRPRPCQIVPPVPALRQREHAAPAVQLLRGYYTSGHRAPARCHCRRTRDRARAVLWRATARAKRLS